MSQKKSQSGIVSRITSFLDRLSTSNLVFLVGAIFLVDLVVLDPVPFVDEIVLGVLTILLARWRTGAQKKTPGDSPPNEEGGGQKPPPKNVTPKR